MAIEGLKLQMTSAEMVKTMQDRIKYHADKVVWLEQKIKELAPEFEKFADEAQAQGKFATTNRIGAGTIDGFKSSLSHHADRVTLFRFMVEHVIPNETYILREDDLRKLEVLPSW